MRVQFLAESKETRFKELMGQTSGKTSDHTQEDEFVTLGNFEVALFIGDNVLDCPEQTQKQYDSAKFASFCVALPNPMYGSWQSTAESARSKDASSPYYSVGRTSYADSSSESSLRSFGASRSAGNPSGVIVLSGGPSL